jgi:hypothetical protein
LKHRISSKHLEIGGVMDFLQEGKTENLPKRESLSQKKRKRFSLRTPVGKWVIDAESKAIRDTSELARWSRKETATMLNTIKSVQWYMKKHGFLLLRKLALIRLRSKVENNKQVVYVCDLKDHQPVRNEMRSNLTVDNYKSLEDIPNNELAQLRKCLICGKPVQEVDLWPHNGMPAMINAAVIGGSIEIYGHRDCIYNVDRIVVFQNRMRIKSFIEKLKEKVSSMNEANEMLQGILEMIDLVEPNKSW